MAAFLLCSRHVVIIVTGVVQQMAVKCLVKMVPLLKGDTDYFALREKGRWGHSPLGQPFPFSVSSGGALVVSEKAKTAGYARREALAFSGPQLSLGCLMGRWEELKDVVTESPGSVQHTHILKRAESSQGPSTLTVLFPSPL